MSAIPASRPGGVEIKKILLSRGSESVDLSAVFVALVVFEDIFAPTMSGHILIEDTHNVVETLPILCDGTETIDIEYTTHVDGPTDTTFKKQFVVFNISDYEIGETVRSATYKIHFTSVELLTNFKKRLNRSFGSEAKQIKSSSVVTTVCTKMLDIPKAKLQVDKTRFDRNFVCANWTPIQTLNYLAASDVLDTSGPASDKDSTFVFYEDREGFKFVAWSTIIENLVHKNQYIKKLNYRPNIDDGNKKSYRDIDAAKIVSLYFDRSANELDNTRAGMHSSRTTYHDILNKKITTVEYDYTQDFKKLATVDDSLSDVIATRDANPKESTMLLPGEYHYSKFYNTSRPWIQISRSRIQQLENYVIYATVVGNTAHKLASVVDCEIPSVAIQGYDSKLYGALSGKYIVSKIKHELSANGLFQTLELRKGSRKKANKT